MINRPALLAALTFLLTVLAQAADVVIYKGAAQYAASLNATPPPATIRVYFVIDFETGQTGSLLYYNKDGKKVFSSASTFNVTRGTSQNVKPITIVAGGSATNTDIDSFFFSTLMLRGFDSSLKVASSPSERIIPRPRVLKGLAINPSSNESGGSFTDIRYNLRFNSALTVAANNEPKTVAQVLQELMDLLIAQGYEAP